MGFNINTATPEELAELAGYLRPPVVTQYPETDASKAGQRFIYKGNEWHYMTQAEIDSTGWTDLVEVGFPAPVSKLFDFTLYIPSLVNRTILNNFSTSSTTLANEGLLNTVIPEINFLGLGKPNITQINLRQADLGGISNFRNAQLLNGLEDVGTFIAFELNSGGGTVQTTAETLNDLFTQLPFTTRTATIDVKGNIGAATCDPSIATAKGYTVIT